MGSVGAVCGDSQRAGTLGLDLQMCNGDGADVRV